MVYFLACVMAFSIDDKKPLTIWECYLICHNVSMQQNSTTLWSNLLRSANLYGFADPTNYLIVMCLQEAANETCCTQIRSRDPFSLGLLIRLCDSYFDTTENKFKILHVPQKLTFWFISCHDEPLSSKCVMNECVKSTNAFMNKSLCNGCADDCPNHSFSDKISPSSETKNLLWCVLVVLNLFHWTSCLQNHLENWFPGLTQPL